MLFLAVRDVAEHTRSVGRKARLNSTCAASLLVVHDCELTSVLEAKGEQECCDDCSEEYNAEDEKGEQGGVEHGGESTT